jgi:hypothetical protein
MRLDISYSSDHPARRISSGSALLVLRAVDERLIKGRVLSAEIKRGGGQYNPKGSSSGS